MAAARFLAVASLSSASSSVVTGSCGGVDADVDQVLGVELEVEPRAADREMRAANRYLPECGCLPCRDRRRRPRAVHLAHDHALGAVHDEVRCRSWRHVAHVDILSLMSRMSASRFLVDVPDHELEP